MLDKHLSFLCLLPPSSSSHTRNHSEAASRLEPSALVAGADVCLHWMLGSLHARQPLTHTLQGGAGGVVVQHNVSFLIAEP